MSALDDLMKKQHTSNLERCILSLADPLHYDEDYVSAERAAEELSHLRALVREAFDALQILPLAGNVLTMEHVRKLAVVERKLMDALEKGETK